MQCAPVFPQKHGRSFCCQRDGAQSQQSSPVCPQSSAGQQSERRSARGQAQEKIITVQRCIHGKIHSAQQEDKRQRMQRSGRLRTPAEAQRKHRRERQQAMHAEERQIHPFLPWRSGNSRKQQREHRAGHAQIQRGMPEKTVAGAEHRQRHHTQCRAQMQRQPALQRELSIQQEQRFLHGHAQPQPAADAPCRPMVQPAHQPRIAQASPLCNAAHAYASPRGEDDQQTDLHGNSFRRDIMP